MKTLALKTETIRVLQSSDLDGVHGGVGKLSSVFQGGTENETHVSSAKPTSQAVSSARHHHHQAAQPTSSAVSSAHHLSSVLRR